MSTPTEEELSLVEILHCPVQYQEFITPVAKDGTTRLSMRDWLDEDHWATVRNYQIPGLAWDHLLPEDVPIQSKLVGGIDRKSLGDSGHIGGRKTSKSWDFEHDVIQSPPIHPGENELVTSRDEVHLSQRMNRVWTYLETHPLISLFVEDKRKADPFPIIIWANGATTEARIESTTGQGDNYLGMHKHRARFDEFQLTSAEAWEKFYQATSEGGCVVRWNGVHDGRRDTPMHELRNANEWRHKVHIRPSFVSPFWSPRLNSDALKQYGSITSQGYVTNVLAEEGEAMTSVWPMEDILACIPCVPEDRRKKIEERRRIACPTIRVEKNDLLGDEKTVEYKIYQIALPPVVDHTMLKYISVDVGKRQDPSVIGIWGVDGERAYLWGVIVLYHIDYIIQAKICKRLIEHYNATAFGIDRTGHDGDAILEQLDELFKGKRPCRIFGVDFRSNEEVPELAIVKPARGRFIRKKQKMQVNKVAMKEFTTARCLAMIRERAVQLLYSQEMMSEFASEVSEASSGRSTNTKEIYHAPRGDHWIAMFRILGYMVYKMAGYMPGETPYGVDLGMFAARIVKGVRL